jgi:hypothetical protein
VTRQTFYCLFIYTVPAASSFNFSTQQLNTKPELSTETRPALENSTFFLLPRAAARCFTSHFPVRALKKYLPFIQIPTNSESVCRSVVCILFKRRRFAGIQQTAFFVCTKTYVQLVMTPGKSFWLLQKDEPRVSREKDRTLIIFFVLCDWDAKLKVQHRFIFNCCAAKVAGRAKKGRLKNGTRRLMETLIFCALGKAIAVRLRRCCQQGRK